MIMASKFGHGLVIGKFDPPHKGHQFLIETALNQVERLTVVVCDGRGQRLAATVRVDLLQKLYPAAQLVLLDTDSFDASSSEAWTEAVLAVLAERPGVMFSSEETGAAYAAMLGMQHVLVDQARRTIPISASAIWSDVSGNQDFLDYAVQEALRGL